MNTTNNERSIMTFCQYGQIHLYLKKYMDQHNISRNNLARMVNTRFEVIDKWYKDDVAKLDTDILARICYVLHCEVDDILKYEMPATGSALPVNQKESASASSDKIHPYPGSKDSSAVKVADNRKSAPAKKTSK